MSTSVPTPFHVFFPHTEVDRMLQKVRDTRLAPNPILPDPNLGWSYGLNHEWFTALKKHWDDEWDWEKVQRDINRFPHFRVEIEDLNIHFIHVKSARPDAIPLILVHGWPSTFLEFQDVIEPLTNPKEGEQAFDVVVPSLPGYTFSSPPTRAWTSDDTARVFNTLMVDVLGYRTYGAVGGDLGTRVLTSLLYHHQKSVLAAHYTMLSGAPPPSTISTLLSYIPFGIGAWAKEKWDMSGLSAREKETFKKQEDFVKHGGGYKALQQTRPATIGASLYDNPVGILAYISDKYHEWADPAHPHSPSHIITTAALYHLTGCITTSFLPYRDYSPSPLFPSWPLRSPATTPTATPNSIITKAPVGYSAFPEDMQHMPRRWMEGWVEDLRYYNLHKEGGHFNALEASVEWVEAVREMMGGNFLRR